MEVDLIGLDARGGLEKINAIDIANKFGKTQKNLAKCGTTILHRLGENETLEQLATDSANTAMQNAGISAHKIGGIYASICCPTTKYLMPGLARVVGNGLGVNNIPMITLSMGCAGGIHAMQAAYNQLMVDSINGKTGTMLVIAGDYVSRALDPTVWNTSSIFSDGIATMVLSTEKEGNYKLNTVKSTNLEGDIQSMNIINPSENFTDRKATFRMDGPKVLDFAYKQTFVALMDLLNLNSLPANCYFIPHQASGIVLSYLIKENKINPDQVYTRGIEQVGNMTGASTFFGLDEVIKQNLAKDKDIILGAFGAELAVGLAYLEKRK